MSIGRYQIAITVDNDGNIYEIRIDTTNGRIVSRETLKGGAYVQCVSEEYIPTFGDNTLRYKSIKDDDDDNF